jgi:hypothetical protein
VEAVTLTSGSISFPMTRLPTRHDLYPPDTRLKHEGHKEARAQYDPGPPPSSLSGLSSLRVFEDPLLSPPFPSAFLGCSGVLAIVVENRLEEILVGLCRLLGETLGETPAGLLPSSGLIDLLSPNIQEVVMLLRDCLSCFLDDHSGSPPFSHIASGKTFPFPFPNC